MDEVKDALHQAYAGEAKAALRLRMYAKIAKEEGYPQIAKLFNVIALSEGIHGEKALRLLKEVKSTEENLKASFESEEQVAGVAYDRFIRIAEEAGDNAARIFFTHSRDVEGFHAKLYKEMLSHIMEERDTTYYVCKVCGYVSDGVVPEECPVCGAKKDQFFEYSGE